MRSRINNRTREKFKNSIRDVISGLSRKVQVHKQPIRHECHNCYFDRLTNKSTGKCKWTLLEAEARQAEYSIANPGSIMYKWFNIGRCPVCKGNGYIEARRKVFVECLVTWNPQSRFTNDTTFTPAGIEGSTMVQLKTDSKYMELFSNCSKIVIDGIECKLQKPPVCRGLGNDSILVISAFTTDRPITDKSEILKDYS